MQNITQQIGESIDLQIEAGKLCNIFEFSNEESADSNSETEIVLRPGARLNYVFGLFGGQSINKNMKFILQENAELNFIGLFLNEAEQEHRVNALINHVGPHSLSNVKVRGIVKDKAFNRFQGNIRIEKEAQQSCGNLEQRVLLLNRGAISEGQPELEIFANDVKASHAAALSSVNEDQMFYMTSRGISREQAQEMIVAGFLKSLLPNIEDKSISEQISKLAKLEC